MKKIYLLGLVAVCSALVSIPAFAGPGHDHDREGPQPVRRWSQPEKSAEPQQEALPTSSDLKERSQRNPAQKDGEVDTSKGTDSKVDSLPADQKSLTEPQTIEQPKVQQEKRPSDSESAPRKRPFHFSGRLGS